MQPSNLTCLNCTSPNTKVVYRMKHYHNNHVPLCFYYAILQLCGVCWTNGFVFSVFSKESQAALLEDEDVMMKLEWKRLNKLNSNVQIVIFTAHVCAIFSYKKQCPTNLTVPMVTGKNSMSKIKWSKPNSQLRKKRVLHIHI